MAIEDIHENRKTTVQESGKKRLTKAEIEILTYRKGFIVDPDFGK